ncbi:Retinol dehydrogenase 12 [Chamberlinius hualienensis]
MSFYVIAGIASSVVVAIRCYLHYFKWGRCNCPNTVEGKTVLITGANIGLGKETTKELVKRGAKVIMACRDVIKGQQAAEDIHRLTGCDLNKLIVKPLDLASLKSVRKFANMIIDDGQEIDILINNAGVCRCPLGQTYDYFEWQFGVNYLGPFLLTRMLVKSVKDRIIFVTSSLYENGNIEIDNYDKFSYEYLLDHGGYHAKRAYNDSKLAQVLFARRLGLHMSRRSIDDVNIFCVSPGMVHTNLGRHSNFNLFTKILLLIAGIFFIRTPNEGIQSILHCSLINCTKFKSAKLYRNCREIEWNKIALNDELAENLWKKSKMFVQQT